MVRSGDGSQVKPTRGDLVDVRYHDLTGSATDDPERAGLAWGNCVGWFVGYRKEKGVRMLVTARSKWDDGSYSGYDAYPVKVVESIAIIKRKKT